MVNFNFYKQNQNYEWNTKHSIYWKSWIYLKLVGRSNIRAIIFIFVFVSFLFLFLEYTCQWVTLSYSQTVNSLSWPWRGTHKNKRKTIHTKLYTVVSGKLEMYTLTWEYNHMFYMLRGWRRFFFMFRQFKR